MLRVRALSHSYGGKRVLDNIDLALEGGTVTALLGPNGAGKTTFMKIIAGLVLPDSGSVELGGSPPTGEAVGFSPGEERSFYGRLTGRENLRFFAALRGLAGAKLDERIASLDRELDLKGPLDTPYQKSSSGMKQKLSVARAVLHEPSVLLLDEPTRSLDPAGAIRLRDFIAKRWLAKDRIVLWSTHQVREAWETAGRIAVLADGRVRALGAPEDVLKQAGESDPEKAFLKLTERAP